MWARSFPTESRFCTLACRRRLLGRFDGLERHGGRRRAADRAGRQLHVLLYRERQRLGPLSIAPSRVLPFRNKICRTSWNTHQPCCHEASAYAPRLSAPWVGPGDRRISTCTRTRPRCRAESQRGMSARWRVLLSLVTLRPRFPCCAPVSSTTPSREPPRLPVLRGGRWRSGGDRFRRFCGRGSRRECRCPWHPCGVHDYPPPHAAPTDGSTL